MLNKNQTILLAETIENNLTNGNRKLVAVLITNLTVYDYVLLEKTFLEYNTKSISDKLTFSEIENLRVLRIDDPDYDLARCILDDIRKS